MLKIATHINNLSDARYFAAAGFDWLIFEVDENTVHTAAWIYGVMQWVSGIHIGLSVSSYETYMDMAEKVPELHGYLHAYDVTETMIFLPAYTHFTDRWNEHKEMNFFIVNPGKTEAILPQLLIIDITDSDPGVLTDLPFGPAGIALSGGHETMPGLKSYDDLEKWIEWLEKV